MADESRRGDGGATEAFVTSCETLAARRLDAVLPQLAALVRDGDRVLDVGCGPGTITIDVAELRPAPSRVVGVDHSEHLLSEARRRAAARGLVNIAFERADASRLPFADGSFDLAYSNALLDWLVDPVAAWREQARVTRRGGLVVTRMSDLSTQSFDPPCPDVERVIAGLRRLAAERLADGFWNPFLAGEATPLMAAAGLEVLEAHPWSATFRSSRPDEHTNVVGGILRSSTAVPYSRPVATLVRRGDLDAATVARAHDQLIGLARDPCGTSTRRGLVAIARVP